MRQPGRDPSHALINLPVPLQGTGARPIRGTMLAERDSLLRRLHELRSEHRDLDTVIARLEDSLHDQLQLQRLKKRKLKLKDEIAWLESRLVPDIIA